MPSSSRPEPFAAFRRFWRAISATRAVLLVADDNTMAAAGKAVADALVAAGITVDTQIFPGKPRLKASVENGRTIQSALTRANAVPLAVGAGVINDLVKYAAHGAGLPYFCVATAASMDGYASAGSPLVDGGFKHTITCRPPRVMVADLDVIAAAPIAMTGWGYADLAGKLPAGADWILADALGVEAIDDVAWPLVQDGLRGWLNEPERLLARRQDGNGGAVCWTGRLGVGHGIPRLVASRLGGRSPDRPPVGDGRVGA